MKLSFFLFAINYRINNIHFRRKNRRFVVTKLVKLSDGFVIRCDENKCHITIGGNERKIAHGADITV